MITVIIPVLDEAKTVAKVVAYARRSRGVTEVLVVDDGSIDDTAARAMGAGARVIRSTLLGKGASMEDGMRVAKNEAIVYLDGDLSRLGKGVVERLAEPILSDRADLVKGSFTRSGGRVTTLTARPLLLTFFPEAAAIDQPLGGLIAARRSLLRQIRFETDYGADIGLLLDASRLGARIEQVPIGWIRHDRQPLAALADMARQVVRVILDRAARAGRLHSRHVREVEEVERHAQSELSSVIAKVGMPERLALIELDCLAKDGAVWAPIARRLRRSGVLAAATDAPEIGARERMRRISRALEGVTRDSLFQAAKALPLRPGASDAVMGLRRAGYRVGVFFEGPHAIAHTVRRRVFADFSLAHLLHFRNRRVVEGAILLAATAHLQGCSEHSHCLGNVLRHLEERTNVSASRVLVVGRSRASACLMRAAGASIALGADDEAVRGIAGCLAGDFAEVLAVAADRYCSSLRGSPRSPKNAAGTPS